LRNETHWVLIDDHSVGRGGARVLVDSSAIDGRLQSRVLSATAAVLGDARQSISRDLSAEIDAEGAL
jgi:flagellar biosynthesis/type III secretory pathway protein FliH